MKRIIYMFTVVLVLAAVMLLPVTDALAAEGEAGASPSPADYITVDSGTVTLHSDSMAKEGISSLQLTLTGADGFTFGEALASRMTYVSRTADGVTIYIAGESPLMAEGTDTLVLGTVTAADGTVKLAANSLKYVYGSRTVIRNVVDEEEVTEPQAGDTADQAPEATPDATPEPTQAPETTPEYRPPVGGQPDSGFTDNNAGGVIGDGYDDGTGSGDPEPTATPEPTLAPTATPAPTPAPTAPPEPTQAPTATPEPTAEPTATAAPTETPVPTAEPTATVEPTKAPVATSEPLAGAVPTAAPTATAQPAAAGPQAPRTGDETVFAPWAMTLVLCGGLLAAVLLRGKRRQ